MSLSHPARAESLDVHDVENGLVVYDTSTDQAEVAAPNNPTYWVRRRLAKGRDARPTASRAASLDRPGPSR